MRQRCITTASPSSAFAADWRDVSAYPLATARAPIFAWQFLRRNPDYANDFELVVELAQTGASDGELGGFSACLAAKWGLLAMVDPAISASPRWRPDANPRHGDDDEAPSNQRFIAVSIDVSRPLRPQLVAIKTLAVDSALKWAKAYAEDVPRSPRIGGQRNGVIFLECLRTLDAISAGVPRREIRSTLWPHLDENDRRERVRHRTKRGLELVESGFLTLAANESSLHSEADAVPIWREIVQPPISPSASSVDRVG